jgi:hypothetical protein
MMHEMGEDGWQDTVTTTITKNSCDANSRIEFVFQKIEE